MNTVDIAVWTAVMAGGSDSSSSITSDLIGIAVYSIAILIILGVFI